VYAKRELVLSRKNKVKASEILGIEAAAFRMALRERYEGMDG